MEALSIVVDLCVFEHVCWGCIARIESFAVDGFHFQAVNPTFHRSIVVAVALGTHAANHAVLIEQLAVLFPTALTAAIGMHDHPARSLTVRDGHAQCIANQCRGQACVSRPVNASLVN